MRGPPSRILMSPTRIYQTRELSCTRWRCLKTVDELGLKINLQPMLPSPESMRGLERRLKGHHHYGTRADMNEKSRTAAEKLTDEQKRSVTNVVMPLVRRHPITERKAPYGVVAKPA
jgi:hypothetical protein